MAKGDLSWVCCTKKIECDIKKSFKTHNSMRKISVGSAFNESSNGDLTEWKKEKVRRVLVRDLNSMISDEEKLRRKKREKLNNMILKFQHYFFTFENFEYQLTMCSPKMLKYCSKSQMEIQSTQQMAFYSKRNERKEKKKASQVFFDGFLSHFTVGFFRPFPFTNDNKIKCVDKNWNFASFRRSQTMDGGCLFYTSRVNFNAKLNLSDLKWTTMNRMWSESPLSTLDIACESRLKSNLNEEGQEFNGNVFT